MEPLNEVIDELFLSYCRTEEFVSLNEEGRNQFVDRVEELKKLVAGMKKSWKRFDSGPGVF